MAVAPSLPNRLARTPLLIAGGMGVLLAVLAMRLTAQVEGDRGIPPVATSSDIQITGIEVETTGDSGEDARLKGWKLAQRKAWEKAGGPAMGDGAIESMVNAVVIEREQIGPRRYFATLSVVFDRARAGQYISGGGVRSHSAPLLVIPVLLSGGVEQVFEVKGPWQAAWAAYNAGSSPIDYVRPVGSGGDSLLVTAGQVSRRSRLWWRNVLDQFGAADVVSPQARLERQWPGGPVHGTFVARYGPDNTFYESFRLTAQNEAGVPKMLAEAVVRLDQAYGRALAEGKLRPDPSLNQVADASARLSSIISRIAAGEKPAAASANTPDEASATSTPGATETASAAAAVSSVTVQFASPDAAAVDAALAAVRGAAGVKSAATTSLAMGGTSVMRVSYAGEIGALAAALRAKGWQVSQGGATLSIRR